MSTHNIGFNQDLTKLSLNYHQISSNTNLISSAENLLGIMNRDCAHLLHERKFSVVQW